MIDCGDVCDDAYDACDALVFDDRDWHWVQGPLQPLDLAEAVQLLLLVTLDEVPFSTILMFYIKI